MSLTYTHWILVPFVNFVQLEGIVTLWAEKLQAAYIQLHHVYSIYYIYRYSVNKTFSHEDIFFPCISIEHPYPCI